MLFLTNLTIVCSILGVLGAILNCRGKILYSYILWVPGNLGWIAISILSGWNVYIILMWVTYAITGIIGFRRYWKERSKMMNGGVNE